MLPKQNIQIVDEPSAPQQPTEPQALTNARGYAAASGIVYPEHVIEKAFTPVPLQLERLPIQVYQKDVDLLDGEEFALIRRNGFGGSDASVLLGVNPFTTLSELIKQKASTEVTEEEKAIGLQSAVIKGNDLEPLIIQKFKEAFNINTIKPTDMYVFTEHPYLKMNFDGVTDTPDQYIPVEIKVVTHRGEKHYNPAAAIYSSRSGFKPLPQNMAITNNSIETKAHSYGIPAYYYTQLQQELLALNAPYGFLCSLWEYTWEVHCYFIHRDTTVQNAIIVSGFKAWEQVEDIRQLRDGSDYVMPTQQTFKATDL